MKKIFTRRESIGMAVMAIHLGACAAKEPVAEAEGSMLETIDEVTVVETTDSPTTEELLHDLEERGFVGCVVTVPYDVDGTELAPEADVAASEVRYPYYKVEYNIGGGKTWKLHVTDGQWCASLHDQDDPASAAYLLVEGDVVSSYNPKRNTYTTWEIGKGYLIEKRVERIDAELLGRLDGKALSEL